LAQLCMSQAVMGPPQRTLCRLVVAGRAREAVVTQSVLLRTSCPQHAWQDVAPMCLRDPVYVKLVSCLWKCVTASSSPIDTRKPHTAQQQSSTRPHPAAQDEAPRRPQLPGFRKHGVCCSNLGARGTTTLSRSPAVNSPLTDGDQRPPLEVRQTCGGACTGACPSGCACVGFSGLQGGIPGVCQG